MGLFLGRDKKGRAVARGRGYQMKGDREAGGGERAARGLAREARGEWEGPPGAGLAQRGVSRCSGQDPIRQGSGAIGGG